MKSIDNFNTTNAAWPRQLSPSASAQEGKTLHPLTLIQNSFPAFLCSGWEVSSQPEATDSQKIQGQQLPGQSTRSLWESDVLKNRVAYFIENSWLTEILGNVFKNASLSLSTKDRLLHFFSGAYVLPSIECNKRNEKMCKRKIPQHKHRDKCG